MLSVDPITQSHDTQRPSLKIRPPNQRRLEPHASTESTATYPLVYHRLCRSNAFPALSALEWVSWG